MGLSIRATGFEEEIFDSGYGGFNRFRIALAKAYDKEFGQLYEKWLNSLYGPKLTNKELKRMNELCCSSLDILLQHEDCGGKLTPKQCKAIYEITKDLKCDYPQMNYLTKTGKNQLEVFNRALFHCWKRRVIMRFE